MCCAVDRMEKDERGYNMSRYNIYKPALQGVCTILQLKKEMKEEVDDNTLAD